MFYTKLQSTEPTQGRFYPTFLAEMRFPVLPALRLAQAPLRPLSDLLHPRFSQVLKGAVGATLCQNEAELKFSMEIDHHISSTEQARKIRLRFSLLVLLVRSGGNLHWKLYFCLILAEDRANCSFKGLILSPCQVWNRTSDKSY